VEYGGEFTQHDQGLLRMDVKTREEHDQIAVNGKARVAGRLNVRNAQQFMETDALTDAQRRKQPDAYGCLVRVLNDQ
jgi:hypothetical protein